MKWGNYLWQWRGLKMGGMEASKAGFWQAATMAMVRQWPRVRERMRVWGGRREAALAWLVVTTALAWPTTGVAVSLTGPISSRHLVWHDWSRHLLWRNWVHVTPRQPASPCSCAMMSMSHTKMFSTTQFNITPICSAWSKWSELEIKFVWGHLWNMIFKGAKIEKNRVWIVPVPTNLKYAQFVPDLGL
jgi:hypothetical protein